MAGGSLFVWLSCLRVLFRAQFWCYNGKDFTKKELGF